VSENGEAIGAEVNALADGIDAGFHGLMREAVNQVEVDAIDARSSEPLGCRGGLCKALSAMNGLLDRGVETLQAETGAGRAAIAGVSVRGSISIAISASGSTENEWRSDPTRSVISSGDIMGGVAPPK